MFNSMNMHMPVVIVLIVVVLVVVAAGLFVAVRVAGQRVFDDESASANRPPEGPP